MPGIVVLEDIELIPVVELEPSVFAANDRSLPSSMYEDMPEEWYRYWLESLADSGIAGLMPVQRGSWHVPTSEFHRYRAAEESPGVDLPKSVEHETFL